MLRLLALALAVLPAGRLATMGTQSTGAGQWVPPYIYRDACTTFPVVGSANSGTVSSVTAANLCSAGGAATVVCGVGLTNANPTDWGTITVAWASTNSSCTETTNLTNRRADVSVAGNYRTGFWTATCSGSFSGISVTATPTSGSTNAVGVIACEVLHSVGSIGVSNGKTWAVSAAATVALTGGNTTTAGSWVYAVAAVESVSAVTLSNLTTEFQDVTNAGGPTVGATGVNTAGAGGDLTLGWSTTSTWGAATALELKP